MPCSQVLQPLVTVKVPDFDWFTCLKILRIAGMNRFIFFLSGLISDDLFGVVGRLKRFMYFRLLCLAKTR